jgi:hypothetical protein
MRGVFGLILAFVFALPALAQFGFYRGTPSVAGRTFGHGFGNVVFPGTGGPSRFSITDPSFASRVSGIVSGYRPYTGAPSGSYYGQQRGGYVPVAYPVYIGGYGGYPDYPQQPAPNITIINNPPQQTTPQVVINQSFGAEYAKPPKQESTSGEQGVRYYQAPVPEPPAREVSPEQDSKPTVYLIAFKDSTVRAALGYWIEGDTLHYVTTKGRPNKASLDLVDEELSEQLNRERSVEFELSSAR